MAPCMLQSRVAVLQTHDSRFEKLFEQYDDDQIGALDEHEDEAAGNADIGKTLAPTRPPLPVCVYTLPCCRAVVAAAPVYDPVHSPARSNNRRCRKPDSCVWRIRVQDFLRMCWTNSSPRSSALKLQHWK